MTQFNTMNESTNRHRQQRPREQQRRPGAAMHADTRRDNSGTLFTRRQLLYGAVGVGAVAAAGVGFATFSANSTQDTTHVDHLEVPTSAVTALADLNVVDNYEDKVRLVSDHKLPYGTLVWMNDDAVAACLLPTETGTPLTQVGLLHLGSGSVSTILEKAVGSDDRFEIYDVRATSEGLVWTEANVLKGAWRVYAAKLTGDSAGEPILLEEGTDTCDTPTLGAVGSHAFWQVIPKAPNDDGLPSRLMSATFGKDDATSILESARRMGTPIYSGEDSVTVTPRLDMATVYYQLTNVGASNGEVRETLTLPGSMAPLEAGYGRNGFMFSFSDIYNFDNGISNLGTYTPFDDPKGDYSNARWFSFSRTPSAAPAWCKNLLIVKSTYSVCGVDLSEGTYFAIDVDDGADTYGEYLATSGTHDTFVTYANIDYTPVEGEATHACKVKVWTTA